MMRRGDDESLSFGANNFSGSNDSSVATTLSVFSATGVPSSTPFRFSFLRSLGHLTTAKPVLDVASFTLLSSLILRRLFSVALPMPMLMRAVDIGVDLGRCRLLREDMARRLGSLVFDLPNSREVRGARRFRLLSSLLLSLLSLLLLLLLLPRLVWFVNSGVVVVLLAVIVVVCCCGDGG